MEWQPISSALETPPPRPTNSDETRPPNFDETRAPPPGTNYDEKMPLPRDPRDDADNATYSSAVTGTSTYSGYAPVPNRVYSGEGIETLMADIERDAGVSFERGYGVGPATGTGTHLNVGYGTNMSGGYGTNISGGYGAVTDNTGLSVNQGTGTGIYQSQIASSTERGFGASLETGTGTYRSAIPPPAPSPMFSPAPAYILVSATGEQQPLYTRDSPAARYNQDTASIRSYRPIKTDHWPMPPPKEHKRIWGLSRETFVAVMAGLAVFVIGLLATVLAVTLGSWGSSSTSSTVSTGVLSDSKLAALNWTDYSGVDHTAVAYQHKSNAIMISTRNSLTGIWTNVNVTESVMNATKSTGLDVLPGTPLAYATNKGLWNLYYLTSDNAVAELYSTNPLTGQWLMGEFGARTGAQAVAGSRLGAVWQSCQNCSNSLLVIWQKENGQVQLANYTNMAWELRDVIAESAPPGTGMAISAFTDSRGTGEFGTDTNSLRAYVADGSNLMENQNGPDTDFTWDLGNSAQPISSGLSVTPCPEVVSITYGENGWDNNLVTYLSADGDLVSNIWRGSAWDVQAPVLAGAPEGVDTFSSIATTQQMRTFALANGVIHEYTTTAANPFTWLWVGKVVTED